MSTRRRELELLLSSLDDHLGSSPYGKVWGGYSRAQPGPAPTSRRPCTVCDGVGRVIPSGRPCVACRDGLRAGAHPCSECSSCAGHGWRWVDAYTETPVAHEEHARPRRAGAGGRVRARGHAVRAEGLERDAGRWETARERADRAGSYPELRAALERLPFGERRLIVRVHVRGVDGRLTEAEALRLDEAMRCLSELMPAVLRLPQWLREQLEGERRRNRAADLHAGGASLRAIQRELGVRKPALRRLLGAD